jgi:hypothetical protein
MLSDEYLLQLSEIQVYLMLNAAPERVREINGNENARV